MGSVGGAGLGVWGPSVPSAWWRWTPWGRRRMRTVLSGLLADMDPTRPHSRELQQLLRRFGG